MKIKSIRSDHGVEFDSSEFEEFCEAHGISQNFSAPRTPHQNGVVEQKNRSLLEMARTMLCEHHTPRIFFDEAVNTSCYLLNRTTIRRPMNKTPFELVYQRKPKVKHLRLVAVCTFSTRRITLVSLIVVVTMDLLFIVGYSSRSKAYRVFNLKS